MAGSPSKAELASFMASVRQMESGGNYRIIGPTSKYGRVSGAYQFLKSTWGGYGGYSEAYLAPKSVQDARAAELMSNYYRQFGTWWLVAVAWHGGPGAAAKAARDPSYASRIADINMSTAKYANSVVSGMGKSGGGNDINVGTTFSSYAGDLGYQPMGAPADEAKRLYGYLGWFVDHPTVGPVILRAASEGWDMSRLLGALSGTTWWRKTSEMSRKWDALVAMDPATAEARVDETALSIGMQSQKFGVKLSNAKLAQMAVKALRFGWNPQEIQLAIAAEMRYLPKANYGGGVGQMMNGVKSTAASFLIPVTKKQSWEWARRMVSGVGTMEAVEAQMRALAKVRFPHLAKLIDQGITPGDYFAPHRQAIASLLEISPDAVNFMDTRWNPVMAFRSNAKSPLRAMTITEASRFARMQPEWNKTQNAWQSVTDTGDQIMQLFGTVKR